MSAASCETPRIKTPNRRMDILARWGRRFNSALVLLGSGHGGGRHRTTLAVTPPQLRGVGIDQRLNNQVPLDLKFRDETGQTVTLGSYFGKKPVILSLVYYTCPMLCTMAENGLLNALRDVKFNIGEQYQVVTVSIDPNGNPGNGDGQESRLCGSLWAARREARLAFPGGR